MSRSNNSSNNKRKPAPLRIIIRDATDGTRHTLSAEAGLTLESTLTDVTSRLSSSSSRLSSGATLVCLRKTAYYDDWGSTTLREMLEGDDGRAGVLLTLHVGGGIASAGKTAVERAARSLNIKTEPMDVSTDSQQQHAARGQSTNNAVDTIDTTIEPSSTVSPVEAWSAVLRSNFDSASKPCLLTLLKIIDNLLSKPNDIKVRSIRCANVNFQQKVGSCRGAVEFLYSLGFVPKFPLLMGGSAREPESLELTKEKESRNVLLQGREVLIESAKRDFGIQDDELPALPKVSAVDSVSSASTTTSSTASTRNSNPTSGFDIYKGHSINIQAQQMGAPDPYADKALSTTERQLQNLEAKKKNLERTMQGSAVEMDRCLVAYLPGRGPSGIAAGVTAETSIESKGDSSLVAARMKRMEEERKKREEGGFTTKAMRDLERMKKAKVYSHAQIRINFPDGTHLHGKFLPSETISTVRAIIRSSFSTHCQSDFDLYVAPPRRLLNDSKTLEEEELVPAAKIHVSWKSSLGNNLAAGAFLKSELFRVADIVESSFPEAKPIVPEKNAPLSVSSSNVGNDEGPSKEEVLMARMMGKGLFGAKTSKGPSGGGGDLGDKKGKPKWFK